MNLPTWRRPAAARALTTAIAGALILSACARSTSTGSAAPSQTPGTTVTATTSPQSSQGSTDTIGAGQAKPKPAGAVPASALKIDLSIQQEGVGLLTVTNASSRLIHVSGWPVLTFERADKSPDNVPTTKVDQPGPPTPVALPPGTTAFAGMHWKTGHKALATSHTLASIRASLPQASGS